MSLQAIEQKGRHSLTMLEEEMGTGKHYLITNSPLLTVCQLLLTVVYMVTLNYSEYLSQLSFLSPLLLSHSMF